MILVMAALMAASADGELGGKCYGNDTCNAGLRCTDGTCISDAGGDGGPCYGNGTCNAGLSCVESKCIRPVDGSEGGNCYGNSTCNPGLECADARCQRPAAAAVVEEKQSGRTRVLVLDLEASAVSKDEAALLNGSVARALAEATALEVLTRRDLSRLAAVEAERQSMGCDATECLAEIASAMGTRYVVYGRVGKLGESFLVQLELFDSDAAKPIGREEVRASRVDALPR